MNATNNLFNTYPKNDAIVLIGHVCHLLSRLINSNFEMNEREDTPCIIGDGYRIFIELEDDSETSETSFFIEKRSPILESDISFHTKNIDEVIAVAAGFTPPKSYYKSPIGRLNVIKGEELGDKLEKCVSTFDYSYELRRRVQKTIDRRAFAAQPLR